LNAFFWSFIGVWKRWSNYIFNMKIKGQFNMLKTFGWTIVKGQFNMLKTFGWTIVKGQFNMLKTFGWTIVKGHFNMLKTFGWTIIKGQFNMLKTFGWAIIKGQFKYNPKHSIYETLTTFCIYILFYCLSNLCFFIAVYHLNYMVHRYRLYRYWRRWGDESMNTIYNV
jgi:hypothetical protein